MDGYLPIISVTLFCSYHILFYIIKNKLLHFFLFQNLLFYSKVDLCPLWRTRKKPSDVICCPYKMKQSHWLLCVAKSCDWSRKITPLSTWINGFPLTAKSTNLNENAGKIKAVIVIRAAQWAEKVGQYLECYWSWKNTLEKLAVAVNTEGHSIRGLNERSVSDGGNLCPLWLVIFKSVRHIGNTL